MNDPIEAQIVTEPSMAVVVQGMQGQQAIAEHKPAPALPLTAQQLRAVEVSAALLPAYERASTLELTETEIAAISAPFPDSFVEIRPHDGLIYIPHIHISDRLNQVLKPGKWALPCRRHWMENNTMYGEYILLIRGCYVGESVGGHPYQPTNPKVNYSDSLESTAAEALRRICGKRLSCGSQVWNPEYARQWQAKYAVLVNGKWQRRIETDSPLQSTKAPQQREFPPTAAPAPQQPKPTGQVKFDERDEKRFREQAEKHLERCRQEWGKANDDVRYWTWAVKSGAILQTEPLSAITWSKLFDMEWIENAVAAIKLGKCNEASAIRRLSALVVERENEITKSVAAVTVGDEERLAFEAVYGPPGLAEPEAGPPPTIPKGDNPHGNEWFWDVIISIPRKGQKKSEYEQDPDFIETLYSAAKGGDDAARKRLFGLAHDWKCEPREYNGKTYPPNEADKQTRKALDAFLEWEKANKTRTTEAMREGVDSEVPF